MDSPFAETSQWHANGNLLPGVKPAAVSRAGYWTRRSHSGMCVCVPLLFPDALIYINRFQGTRNIY